MSVATRILAVVFLFLASAAWAGEVKPFVSGSMKGVAAARQGKAYIVALWSLTCSHCQEELALLGGLLKRHPGLDLVLISTDSPAEKEAVAATLRRHGLDQAESWVFADDFAERLRFEVDRRWHGELPRTYFHAADGLLRAASGKLDPAQAEAWARANAR